MLTLVLLPGMDGTGTLFESFVAALGSESSVKVVHYPTAEPLGYAELEAFAREALPSEEPFVILGESFSGPIAISLAACCSSHLKGLILCCTFVRNPRPALSGLRALIRVLPVTVARAGILNFMLLGAFSTAALRSALARAVAQVSPSVFRARLHAVISVDVSPKLAALKVPVLYLRASHDRVVPRAASDLVSWSYPGAKVVQVEGPHCLLQAAASESARVVRAFLLEVQNAG